MATEAETNQAVRDAHEHALETALEARKAEVRTLPDPMELAKLAIMLKPELAKGTLHQQSKAMAAAKSFFDLAVRNAVELSGAEKQSIWLKLMLSELKKEAEKEGLKDYLSYEPTARGEDQLRAYIRKEMGESQVPITYKKHNWEEVLKNSGCREEGKHLIHKSFVDEKIAEIRKADTDRVATKREERRDQEDAQKVV